MSHILIIDDDADIRLLIVLLLESAGHTAVEAADGPAGLAYLAAHGADCVLLDINMPGMTGWEVCRRIKADPATAHIPVIIQTVRSMVRDQAQCEAAGPDGFVNKPFDRMELLSVIEAVMTKVGVGSVETPAG